MTRRHTFRHPARLALVIGPLVVVAACTTTQPNRPTAVDAMAARDSAAARSGLAPVADSAARTPAISQGGTFTEGGAGTPTGTGTTTDTIGDRAGGTLGAQVDSVTTFARTGLARVEPQRAVAIVQSIENQLRGSSDVALRDIAGDLAQLRSTLSASTLDRHGLAAVLGRLGPKVSAVGGRGGAMGPSLRALGTELSRTATSLHGGE